MNANSALTSAAATRIPLKPPAPSAPRIVHADLPDLHALVSGGQTGADRAALQAGVRLGLSTGGYAPRGWMTTAGPDPGLAKYGLLQHHAWGYPARTRDNVKHSDATIRFARDFESAGEKCTRRAIASCGKIHLDFYACKDGVDVLRPILPACVGMDAAETLRAWLACNKIKILNVAGNSDQTAPGIGPIVEAFLVEALGTTS